MTDNQQDNNSTERRFSQEQYEMLKRCSDNKDMTEWNEWRNNNPKENILLNGVNLTRAFLQGANLEGVELRGATLWEAKLQRTNLRKAFLQVADLRRAKLQGAEFGGAKLQSADFSRAIVDGETLIWNCEIDKKTKFEGVGLENIRIYPKEKQLLEYNIRRMNWEEWYKQYKWYKPWQWLVRNIFVRTFWCMSDYGKSTLRISGCFFGLAAIFGIVYWFWPGLVQVNGGDDTIRSFVHALYFSVVTMTTLGFGDIAANPDNWCGQVLLMVQVIFGYILLGALVTRFAVLFTAGGPAGKFAELADKN